MKHRHIFVPPFWKYNRFCLLCGRLESLTVGKNTVQLTDDKIAFGAATTLNAAKQLGFDASSRLIYHDGTSTKTIANTSEVAGDIVKITSVTTFGVLVNNTTAENTIFEILFTPDFNTYPNGYWVLISPEVVEGHLAYVTNDYNNDGAGKTGLFKFRNYLNASTYGELAFHFVNTIASRFILISTYTIRLVKSGTTYYLVFQCFGRTPVLGSYDALVVYNSSGYDVACGWNGISSSSVPDRIKLTAKWETADSDLLAYIESWRVILYGLK